MAPSVGATTRLLHRVCEGDREAAGELLPIVYDELRRLAGSFMQQQRSGHTLQPTALVHEAFLKLIDRDHVGRLENRAHFLGVAARAMRDVLVDHARARRTQKRGGDRERVPLDGAVALFEENAHDLVELDEALDRLAAMDGPLAHIVELRFFSGLTIADTALVMGVSTPTVERGWRVARAWLREEMDGGIR